MTPAPRSKRSTCLAVFAIALVAQVALALNPGWFSHDELQWAARADVARLADLPWWPWTDVTPLQWRPLTFNLWLPLSWLLFDTPVAWHLLWVGIGAAYAAVFAALLLRLDVNAKVARTAALVFALGPYAVYVHGWVATLADLLWVGIGLVLAHALLTMRAQWRTPGAWNAGAATSTVIVAFALTALALLAKEAALALPALLALCWLLRPREHWLAAATGGALLAAAAYLALRLPVLLHPAETSGYALAPLEVPRNWLAYHLFVLRPSAFEINGLWVGRSNSLWVAGIAWALLWLAVLRADRRLGAAMLLGGALALGPALLLPFTANQYGYGFSPWMVACLALAWPRLKLPAKALAWLFVVVTLWHGANVQREMRRTGERQALFQPALVAALATHRGPLRLYAPPRWQWLYRRVTTDVATWHGHPIGDRVVWVPEAAQADLVVAENGQLAPR